MIDDMLVRAKNLAYLQRQAPDTPTNGLVDFVYNLVRYCAPDGGVSLDRLNDQMPQTYSTVDAVISAMEQVGLIRISASYIYLK